MQATGSPYTDLTGTPLPAKKKATAAWVYWTAGGALCLLLVLCALMLARGKAAPVVKAAPLDRAQLLAADATQLHRDLAGFQ